MAKSQPSNNQSECSDLLQVYLAMYNDNNYQQVYIKAPKQQKKDSHYSTTLHQEKHSKFNITTTLLTQCLKYFLKLSTHTCWE